MRRSAVGSLLSFLYLCYTIDKSVSITDLTPDMMAQNVWCYLPIKHRRMMRELSSSYNWLYEEQCSDEFWRYGLLYAFSRFLRNTTRFVTIEDCMDHLDTFKITNYCNSDHTKQDVTIIERILVQICAAAGTFAHAATVCNTFLHDLRLNVTCHRELRAMHNMVNQVHSEMWLHFPNLYRMFRFGLSEMNRTGNKYNRYTNCAFVFVDKLRGIKILNVEQSPDLERVDVVGILWRNLASTIFLDDYLARPSLRCYDRVVLDRPIRMILREAFATDNDSLDMNSLRYIAQHPGLFFDFDVLMSFALSYEPYSQRKSVKLLLFVVDEGLMERNAMLQAVRQYGTDFHKLIGLHNVMNRKMNRKSNRCCSVL